MGISRRKFVAGAAAASVATSAEGQMLLLGAGSGGPQATDAASTAIFNAFTTPPSAARQEAINDCVLALKACGAWSRFDLLYVLAAADSQAASINWVNPGVKTLSAVNSPTFTADQGYTGNASNARLNTGWAPSTDAVQYTKTDASMWMWVLSEGTSTAYDCGNASTTPYSGINVRSSGGYLVGRINSSSGAQLLSLQSSSIGFSGVQRRASNEVRIFKNGAQVNSNSDASGASLSTAQFWILGSNSINFTSRLTAIYAVGASCAGIESNIYSAFGGYLHAVGAI